MMSYSDLRAYSKLTNPASLLPILIRLFASRLRAKLFDLISSVLPFISRSLLLCRWQADDSVEKENRLDTISYLLPRRWRVKFRPENAKTRFSELRKILVISSFLSLCARPIKPDHMRKKDLLSHCARHIRDCL